MKDINGKETLYISIDTETYLMGRGAITPKMVCMTYTDQTIMGSPEPARIYVPWEDQEGASIADRILWMMEGFVGSKDNVWGYEEVHIVGMNLPYDMRVLAKQYPHLLDYWFKWLDEDRLHDISIREKLYNLTMYGDIDLITSHGITRNVKYHLTDLELAHLGLDRSALKEGDDSVRLTYYLMDQKPLSVWPREYIDYALDDAVTPLQIFACQNAQAKECENITGYNPHVTETFRVRTNFALQLMTWVGSKVDREELVRVNELISTEYMSDRLRKPLLDQGFLRDAVPPQPYKNGTQVHVFGCLAHKEHPQFKKNRKVKCNCPPKMSLPEKESYNKNYQQDYMLAVAKIDQRVKLAPTKSCLDMLKELGIKKDLVLDDEGYFLPDIISKLDTRQIDPAGDPKKKLLFTADDAWMQEYGLHDYYLRTLAERGKLAKMMTDYLPKLFYEDQAGNKHPAMFVHAEYDPLKVTGRTSSYAGKLYPSRNDQNVDPRIRNCTIPRDGNVIVSTDYNGMELGTTAQRCYNLFGYSILRDKINAGVDTHAFLGAQIAFAMDPMFYQFIIDYNQHPTTDYIFEAFQQLKGNQSICESSHFLQAYSIIHPEKADKAVTWGDFWKHFRTFAKPTGLGYPGGLGAVTFCTYAKSTYGIDVTIDQATSLKEIWAATYPEIPEYLKWLGKNMVDIRYSGETKIDEDGKTKRVVWYCYDTPRGMHRAHCTFCQAANGSQLQAFSAEGATDALYEVQKAVWLAPAGSLLDGVIVLAFIHDEILWECPNDHLVGARARLIEKIMVDCMEKVTPDVKAGCESAAMMRWDKRADSIWNGDNLEIWYPKEVA